MSQSTSRSSERSGVLAKLVPPVLFLAVCVIAAGAYYFVFVTKKLDYLMSRDFRYLSTLGKQASHTLESQGRVFRNLLLAERVDPLAEDPSQQVPVDVVLEVSPLFGGVPLFRDVSFVEVPRWRERQGGLYHQLHVEPRGAELALFYWASAEDCNSAWRAKCDPVATRDAKRPVPGTGTVIEPFGLRGTLDLNRLLDPIFASRGAFDSILVADARGQVIYQTGDEDLSVAKLEELLTRRRDRRALEGGRAYEKARSTGGKAGSEPSASAVLTSASDFYDVELSGRVYRLFVEPASLPIRTFDGSIPAGEPRIEPWLICGLVAKQDLTLKSMAVSSVLVVCLLGLLLLAALSWPFAKLHLLGDRQRVRVHDVLLLGLCSVLGVSILTLFLLDVFAYVRLKEVARAQLEQLGDMLAANVHDEVMRANAQLDNLEAMAAESPNTGGGNLLESVALDSYPYIDSFTLVSEDGVQRRKWTLNKRVTARIPLRDRDYFRRAKDGETWWLERAAAPRGFDSFVLEQIVAGTNGRRFAALARPARPDLAAAGFPVSLLSIPMLSLIDPVLPPGFAFAVIDRDGRVVFHSDTQRNGSENLFVETDRNRDLRAAVFARRPADVDLRYWGEDYLAHAVPLEGLPWTVVALHEKRALRSLNVEMVTSTLVFVLLGVGALALASVIVLVTRPRYRASWLWPTPERREDYIELGTAFVLLGAAYALAVWKVPGGDVLIAFSWSLPFVALLAAYLELGGQRFHRLLVEVAGLLLAATFLTGLWDDTRRSLGDWWWRAAATVLFVGAVTIVATRPWRRARAERGVVTQERPPLTAGPLALRLPACHAYTAAGLLLLVLASILPTLAMFKTACGIHLENFVKHGQLHLAARLEGRAVAARQLFSESKGRCKSQLLDDRLNATWDIYAKPFFNTELTLPAPALAQVAGCESGGRLMAVPAPQETDPTCCREDVLAEQRSFVEGLLPKATEHSAEAHELTRRGAADGRWRWRDGGGLLAFESREYPGGERGALLKLRSAVPPSRWTAGSARGGPDEPVMANVAPGFVAAFSLLGLALFVTLLVSVVLFVARRVFLADLLEPLWWQRKGGPPTPGARNLLWVGRSRPGPEKEKFFVCLDLSQLEAGPDAWAAERARLLGAGQPILVKRFEHKLGDAAADERKLDCLEDLVESQSRPIVVLSRMSPSRLLTESRARQGDASTLEERWRRLLTAFTVIEDEDERLARRGAQAAVLWDELLMWLWLTEPTTGEELEVPKVSAMEGEGEGQSATEPAKETARMPKELAVLRREGRHDERLQRMASELAPRIEGMTPEQVLEEFGERAEGHYRSLWKRCSPDERLVLEQLAEEGLVNEKSRRVVRRLMAQGLVVREPSLRLMNETFRRFVVSSVYRGQVREIERSAGPSAWDRFRTPFFASLALGLVFFLATQQEALESAIATVAGVAAAVPALAKVLEVLASSRAGLKGGGG